MNFFETVKKNMTDEEKRRGLRNQVMVDSLALRELLNSYEQMDSFLRVQHSQNFKPLSAMLYDVLVALYAENHDSERLMLSIMQILEPMIKDRIKAVSIDKVSNK